MRKKIGLSLGIALTASACTVGPNYHPPEMAVPARYAGPQIAPGSGATIDPARWWAAFGDPRLDDLVTRALKDNPTMAIAASRVRQARLQEIQAGAVGKPTLNGDANVSHVEFSKNAGFASLARLFSGGSGGSGPSGSTGGVALPGGGITTYALGFDASWELDLFGGGRRGVEAARARGAAAEWDRRDAAVTLTAEVAQAYFALRLDQDQTAVVEQEIARQQGALRIAGNVAKAGLAPQVDIPRQRSSLTTLQARLEPIRADTQVRIHSLGILLGQPPEALLTELQQPGPVLAATPIIPAGLPSDLLRRRPDVRAAERNLAAATADIGVAVADLYPKFSLTGMVQLLSASLGNLFSTNS
ncbi:MAG: efflux transporter outer membrane subunit, partial [Pseudomonadota bacterium]|nr:efflux transporter outer membrane subunit [Pseudomonadota bacterium]